MSGIAGVIYNDGRLATIVELAPVIEKISMLGPDGISTWAEGSAALAHFALHTTPEAAYEQWPLHNAHGDILVADARIDNRDDLIHILCYQPTAGRPITDADLILAAHERWGDDAPAHLVGDFAYALWNSSERVLRLVRSPFGMKGLFYRITRQGVFFASTLRGVEVLAPHNLTTNVPWVASFLTLKMDYLFDESVYLEIKKVPAAHWLRLNIANGTQICQRFWDLVPHDKYATWSDEDWLEGFRDCFEKVVTASLRSDGPIAMSVSGGLDSSSIALIAHRLMYDEQVVQKNPVYAYTDRMPAWPETDESQYRNAVVARLPHFHCQWVEPKEAWKWEFVEKRQRHTSTPMGLPNIFTLDTRIAEVRRQGCKIILTGMGGDIVTGGEDYGILEAFLSLPWSLRLQEWRYFARGTVKGNLKLIKRLLREQFPKRFVKWWLKYRSGPKLYNAKCEQIANSKNVLIEPIANASALQHFLRIVMFTPLYLHPLEEVAEYYLLQGIERRYPFYDRRMVELIFHLPVHLRVAQGHTRVLHKRALKQDLPPLLLKRNTKADFTRFTAYSISPQDHERACALPPNALIKTQGWINQPMWEKWSTNPGRAMRTVYLHRIAHLENWLSLLTSVHQKEAQ